jgi:hypothetical protein
MTKKRQALDRLWNGGRLECYADHGLIIPAFDYDYAQFEPIRISKAMCLKLFEEGLLEADDYEAADAITWYQISEKGIAELVRLEGGAL